MENVEVTVKRHTQDPVVERVKTCHFSHKGDAFVTQRVEDHITCSIQSQLHLVAVGAHYNLKPWEVRIKVCGVVTLARQISRHHVALRGHRESFEKSHIVSRNVNILGGRVKLDGGGLRSCLEVDVCNSESP